MSITPSDNRLTDFVMLDFEASGLETDGWTIEIGLSWITQSGRIGTWSSLIRPDEDWSMDGWSELSAEIHAISLVELDAAPPAEDVAREAFARCDGRLILSDAPEFEQRWLDCLLGTIGKAGWITVRDYDVATFSLADGLRIDRVYEYLARHPAPHRAGPDSRRLAAAWSAAARR